MELWQMDVVGAVLLDDATQAKVLTGIDDHSRFIVCAGVMTKATSRAVCAHFAAAMRAHGVPQEILTDNGKVSPSEDRVHSALRTTASALSDPDSHPDPQRVSVVTP